MTIILPTYNEEGNISKIENQLRKLEGDFDVIFSDGFSTDKTYELITYPKIQEAKYRAFQMNAAAKYAKTEYLWFVHVDSILHPKSVLAIEDSGYEIGCFRLKFDKDTFALRLNSFFTTAFRLRLQKLAFGDQGIFIKRDLFESMGGYKEIPLMEDYQLSVDINKMGKKIELIDLPIITSARRFEKGAFRTYLKMQKLQWKYRHGRDIFEIHKEYESYDGK